MGWFNWVMVAGFTLVGVFASLVLWLEHKNNAKSEPPCYKCGHTVHTGHACKHVCTCGDEPGNTKDG